MKACSIAISHVLRAKMPLFIIVASCFLLFCRVAPTFRDSNSELDLRTYVICYPCKNQVSFAHTKKGSIISCIKVSTVILPPSTLHVNRGSDFHVIIIPLLLRISSDIEVAKPRTNKISMWQVQIIEQFKATKEV